jgi:hypothetical protein
MRDAVYMPEFRQLSTAVSTTAFMMWSLNRSGRDTSPPAAV